MKYLLLFVTLVAAAAQPVSNYVGAGGCNGSNCHGATTPLPERDSRILGNEYATWTVADKHARAYKGLVEARGKRMTEILKIADATRDRRCTVCHVVGSPEKTRTDGVACEACHGSAEQWLGTHKNPNTHEASIKIGMIDTRNPEVRAKSCLSCHLGTGDQVVDHELIAAGHPDLAFELETFDVAQPAHHRMRPAAMRIRAWATGQAVALAEGMRLLAAHAGKGMLEFSDLECYQCHHDLRADSWRIQRGYGSRKPGALQVNTARIEVLRILVATAAPDQRTAFDNAAAQVSPSSAASAQALQRIAESLATRFQQQDVDAAAMIRALTAGIQRVADAGVNAAEQATMSLDALTAALGRPPERTTALYDYLEHPSSYRPRDFADLFRKAASD
jgi:hypothetical protein